MYSKNMVFKNEKNYDVVVVGGGTAGIFAAISAAKTGASTLLIEKTSILGGTVTNCGVNFPGLFHAWGKQIIDGPCWEAITRTLALTGKSLPEIVYKPLKHWHQQIHIDTFTFSAVSEKMCEETGVDLLLHSTVFSVDKYTDETVLGVICKNQTLAVHAKKIIDCTGDANVAEIFGCRLNKKSELQPATLINDISGYSADNINQDTVNELYRRALENGELTAADFQGIGPMASLREHRIRIHLKCADVCGSFERTKLEVTAREKLMQIISFYKKIPGAENIYVSYCAQECGVRETARIVSENDMSAENYISGYRYADAVAYCFYPIDRHIDTGVKQIFHEDGVIPTIPYGSLIPKGEDNILVAGRCAAQPDANSAYRVQAACMAMGQAAGVAAALCAKQALSVRNLPLDELKTTLKKINAIVP